jgi:CheY-like chemotaxis protein
MNVLIVDDDPTYLKLLRTQLESEGHALFEAHDGVEALALLNRQRVDAVISDILMPRMDGYRLCHEIRMNERLHDLPFVLYTSSFSSLGDEKLALDVGADKYLKKPCSLETLETLVAALREVILQPHVAPRAEALGEVEVLKEYSEQLVKKLEEKNTELMAAEGKFRSLVEQTIVGIYIVQDDQIVYVNPRMAGIFGWSEEEMT